eukprot:SAG25_NODE_11469_length_316_cov_1.107843_1_plen_54_part_01
MEVIRKITEICKTRIRQLLRSPYDSGRNLTSQAHHYDRRIICSVHVQMVVLGLQ